VYIADRSAEAPGFEPGRGLRTPTALAVRRGGVRWRPCMSVTCTFEHVCAPTDLYEPRPGLRPESFARTPRGAPSLVRGGRLADAVTIPTPVSWHMIAPVLRVCHPPPGEDRDMRDLAATVVQGVGGQDRGRLADLGGLKRHRAVRLATG